MHSESLVSLGFDSCLQPENNSTNNGDSGVTPCPQNHVIPLQPEKKQTRQWAAWTRQEEESFFTALRQVGKNFEKITCRVQSKNKDQVRHYYYRLVRRMNKLLAPGFCLDAKNSKDTNAAMLRWWSLLEKYSCKASKLHLKPRRFKVFIEALEHQLLKDQKKNVRKRPSPTEKCSSPVLAPASNLSRASGNDSRAVKFVVLDGQNIQKLGPGKRYSLRRNVNVGTNRNNSKVDSCTMKTARQRRNPGSLSSAAYRRWEKAVIAGVSLVADAAEHLEKAAPDKDVGKDQCTPGDKGLDPVKEAVPPFPSFSQNFLAGSNIQSPMKLKLQLFPIDEGTRRALEMDKYNPHLELTLSTRKKISSILEHLNRKWSNSSIASGELMLFPYSVERDNLVGHLRWTQDSIVSAADVYAIIGSPSVFRLRYGWFSNVDLGPITSQVSSASCFTVREPNVSMDYGKEPFLDMIPVSKRSTDHHSQKHVNFCKDQLTSVTENDGLPHSTSIPTATTSYIGAGPNYRSLDTTDPAENISLQKKETDDGTIRRNIKDVDRSSTSNVPVPSTVEWADSLTNMSVGELLSGVSHEMDANCADPNLSGISQCLQQNPFSCDSFDAAIAAHISRQQDRTGCHSALASHPPSIWDAEETCDVFSFPKNSVIHREVPNSPGISSFGACKQIAKTSSSASVPELSEEDGPTDDLAHEDPMDEDHSDLRILDNAAAKDHTGLTDIFWPDSLLDLDIPSSSYHNEDLILSDSLSGLNRLIASSLDAFQNCSFFGLEKKGPTSTVEERETASVSDLKIGSGV